ncbi:endonuclease domain-containing 1 protein-like, partial [Clarias magur]
CLAEVVHDFTLSCPQFFITVNNKVTSPTVFSDNNNKHRYKQICQTLNDEAEFATLYDTANKIPVYSAYTFKGLKDCDRLNKWHIEPQLDDPKNGGKNMERVSDEAYKMLHPNPNQALDGQYVKSGFHRGHLAPVYHANSKSCADATFTLTNAAPQNPSFNSGRWKATEGKMGKILDDKCKNLNMYVVTGVVPGCLAEVVPDFTVNCSQFFANPMGVVSPPTTFIDEHHDRYKLICQTLNNKIEFATYYDMKNRIPVYSAYRFEGLGNCDVQSTWFIEPQ